MYALLPSFLLEAELSISNAWKLSSGALICWVVGTVGFRIVQSRRHDVAMPIPKHVRAGGVIAIGWQIYNILGPGQSWPYLFGIMMLLMNGFSVFLILILNPVDEGNEKNESEPET